MVGETRQASGPSSQVRRFRAGLRPAPADQWTILWPILLAMVLSTAIGLEREAGAKAAGLRTHTLVGLAAAVIMVISKHGFADMLGLEHVALDPSRIAARSSVAA